MKPAFSFQVTGQGAIISFEPDIKFKRIKNELRDHVTQASNFFAGVDLYINIEGRQFTMGQMKQIMEIIKQYNNVNEIYFSRSSEPDSLNIPESRDTVLVKGTIRSGQKVKYPTNIVIMGDVNPGSEIIAAGDIIVVGKLRGVVHAGAGGFKDAEVVALLLDPTQLRIADIISRPPDQEESDNKISPERAFIKNGSIIVEGLKT
ncbi:MAG: septum site-determining protein MinC [Bacillota bacterium]